MKMEKVAANQANNNGAKSPVGITSTSSSFAQWPPIATTIWIIANITEEWAAKYHRHGYHGGLTQSSPSGTFMHCYCVHWSLDWLVVCCCISFTLIHCSCCCCNTSRSCCNLSLLTFSSPSSPPFLSLAMYGGHWQQKKQFCSQSSNINDRT